jgi:hypothetical protein
VSDTTFRSQTDADYRQGSRGPWRSPWRSSWDLFGIGASLRRRKAYRARIAHAEWDLTERYGAAAYGIARSSARQAVGHESRRFWSDVAVLLRQR